VVNPPDPALLADLDADLLDPAHAREVRTTAAADPRATAVLDALRATRADLAALPAPALPPAVAQRWLAALAAQNPPGPTAAADADHATFHPTPDPTAIGPTPAASGPTPAASGPAASRPASPHPASPRTGALGPSPAGPVPDAPARPASGGPDGTDSAIHTPWRRPGSRPPRHITSAGPTPATRSTRRRVAVTSLLAAAALVVGVVVAAVGGRGSAMDVTRVELAAVARSTIGVSDLGVYTDTARRNECLATAGHPGAPVLGGRAVRFDGSPGVLLVLSTGVLGRFRVLVVDDTCRTLADEVVGR
jgi:hypothetical protein